MTSAGRHKPTTKTQNEHNETRWQTDKKWLGWKTTCVSLWSFCVLQPVRCLFENKLQETKHLKEAVKQLQRQTTRQMTTDDANQDKITTERQSVKWKSRTTKRWKAEKVNAHKDTNSYKETENSHNKSQHFLSAPLSDDLKFFRFSDALRF